MNNALELSQQSLAAAKLLQSCLTLCDPIDGSPPSLGSSRQEYWSGLPFPSPMHESEKSKWSRSVVSDSSRSHGLQPTRLLRTWDFPGKSTGVGCHCLPWELPRADLKSELPGNRLYPCPGFEERESSFKLLLLGCNLSFSTLLCFKFL